mmetsp:Transcript_65934/g.103772  ORF Transcript_65934/g.103772 Transcript_65934/m.103772 type:complete len:390 (+) Transcript_65934:65-1234(+)
MQFSCLFHACLACLAVSSPSLPRKRGGNLLQSARQFSSVSVASDVRDHHAQQPDNVYFGDSPQKPDSFFFRDFEKMDELPEEPAEADCACAQNVIIMSTTVPPLSSQPGVQPQQFLLEAQPAVPKLSDSVSVPCRCDEKTHPASPKLPKPLREVPKKGCHPRCIWKCEEKPCNTKCEPRCNAPKCATACEKPKLGECRRNCRDPMCAVVCPPQCEHGACPDCKTVCGDPICTLDCGNRRCESRCADPECVWDCTPDPACAKPQCHLECEQTICAIGKEEKLPSAYEAPYLGQEVAWQGFGKVPVDHLRAYAATMPVGAAMPSGAVSMTGAQMVPAAGLKSLQTAGCCAQDMGVNATAEIVGWQQSQQMSPTMILAPSVLTDRSSLGPHT